MTNTRILMLSITHECNLSCSYCYQKHSKGKEMGFDLAQRLIQKELTFTNRSDKFDNLQIDFIGGEPLLRFGLIRKLAEWLWEKKREVPTLIFMSTNGTLLNKEMKDWFLENKRRIFLGLSLDGNSLSQNLNRSNSSNKIDVDFFRKTWPEQGFKMTVSKESLRSLATDVIFMHQHEVPFSFTLGQGLDWDEGDAKEYEKQLSHLSNFYLKNPNIVPNEHLLIDFSKLLMPQEECIKSNVCGAGGSMILYDWDGSIYPCQMFAPPVQKYSKGSHIHFENESFCDPLCIDCSILPLCKTCYGLNLKYRNDSISRDPSTCLMLKTQLLIASRYQLDLFEKEPPTTDQAVLRAKGLLLYNDRKNTENDFLKSTLNEGVNDEH